jgi:Fe-S-cluster containining protein
VDQARWMVSHRDVWLSVDASGEWYVQFIAPCDHLDPETNRCRVYQDRFDICRRHEVNTCEATYGEGSEPHLFRNLQELDAYLELRKAGKIRGKKRGEAGKRRNGSEAARSRRDEGRRSASD